MNTSGETPDQDSNNTAAICSDKQGNEVESSIEASQVEILEEKKEILASEQLQVKDGCKPEGVTSRLSESLEPRSKTVGDIDELKCLETDQQASIADTKVLRWNVTLDYDIANQFVCDVLQKSIENIESDNEDAIEDPHLIDKNQLVKTQQDLNSKIEKNKIEAVARDTNQEECKDLNENSRPKVCVEEPSVTPASDIEQEDIIKNVEDKQVNENKVTDESNDTEMLNKEPILRKEVELPVNQKEQKEDLNMSQTQIQDNYFAEELVSEDTDKFTSAKKDYEPSKLESNGEECLQEKIKAEDANNDEHEVSKSSKAEKQEAQKEPKNEDAESSPNEGNKNDNRDEEANNLVDFLDGKEDSIPEMDHPSAHDTEEENKKEETEIPSIAVSENEQKLEDYSSKVPKESKKSLKNPEDTLEDEPEVSPNSRRKSSETKTFEKLEALKISGDNQSENEYESYKLLLNDQPMDEEPPLPETPTDDKEMTPTDHPVIEPVIDKIVNKKTVEKLEEQEEEKEIEPPKPLHNLPGEKEACAGASGYNLDNLDLDDTMNSSLPLVYEDEKPKKFMKKPSFVPKKTLPAVEKLDDDLGLIKLTKDESQKRLGEYLSMMIMNKLKSQKWESKVQGIEWLQEWLVFNQVPPDMSEYAFRYVKGIMKEWKETNTNLQKASIEFILNVLKNADRMGKRSINIVIPYLCDNLINSLLNIQAYEAILTCANLNQKCFGNAWYTIKQLMKHAPKTPKETIFKEINTCILMIIRRCGGDGIQLDEFSSYLVMCCGHKSYEVRNEAISIIKEMYTIVGDKLKDNLVNIKPSTMSIINQELDQIELPEHLKKKEEVKDEMLLDESPNEVLLPDTLSKEADEQDDYLIDPSEVSESRQESVCSISNVSDNTSLREEEKSESSVAESKKKRHDTSSATKSVKKPSRSKFSRKEIEPEPSASILAIKDVGSKDARENQDSKAIWNPGEIRPDIIQKLRDHIKAAFGSEMEKDCFSNDFNKHIKCLETFSTAFHHEFNQIDELFWTLDLIIKWIFIKGCEGSNTNTKFLIEILDYIEKLINFLEEQAYEFMEAEGIILLTFLIEKSSNTNATIRDKDKQLIFKLCSNEGLYPVKASFKLLMTGVTNKNAKIKKESLELVGQLVTELQQEIFSSKDLKLIIKEIDSHDKFTRNNALEACVCIYSLIGDKFWAMLGSSLNQKVKDLLTSKFANAPKPKKTEPKIQQPTKTSLKEPSKIEEPKKKSFKPRKVEKKVDQGSNLPLPGPALSKFAKPEASETKLKTFKRFKPVASGRKSFSDSVKAAKSKLGGKASRLKSPSGIPKPSTGQEEPQQIDAQEESKEEPLETVTEAILEAKPIDELIDLANLDQTGTIIEKILYGNIDEKIEALVQFNDILTTKLATSKDSLIHNSEFISRTFADVLDGIFYRCKEDFPAKFVKYMIQIFKKCFSVGFITSHISDEELTVVTEIILLRLSSKSLEIVEDFMLRQEISKDLNDLMINIIQHSEPTACFYTLLSLSKKYDHLVEENQICQLLAKCLIKLTKKVVSEKNQVNFERILLSLHSYLVKHSANIVKFNAGSSIRKHEGNKQGFMAAKNIVYEFVKLKREKIWDYCNALNAHPAQDRYIQSWITLILEKLQSQNH